MAEGNGTFASTLIEKQQQASSDDRILHKLCQCALRPATGTGALTRSGYLTFARMPSISFRPKARIVWVFTLLSAPSLRAKAVTDASSGASSNSTTSYAPIVQN